MSLQILLNPIRDLLDQQLRGILNTGLMSAKVVNATSRYSNGYIQLLFDRDNQKYHTPKVFDASNTKQNMIRLYLLKEHLCMLDVCSKSYEINRIETYRASSVKTKSELYCSLQDEGAVYHVIDANQDYVFARGMWIPLEQLKPKMIYQSDFRKVVVLHEINDIVKAIFNNA